MQGDTLMEFKNCIYPAIKKYVHRQSHKIEK